MRRARSGDLVPLDPDIDKTLRRLRRERNQQEATMMGDEGDGGVVQNKALKDYSIPQVGVSSIQRPPIQANNFEIKPAIIQMIKNMVQFGGLDSDDPNLHIANFLEICDTFKHNGVSDDAIRLRLFPFSLNSKAKAWLTSLPPGTITTWDELVRSFLSKYFPPAKSARMRNDITNFMQQDHESLYEAWERYKDLLRKCSHHGLPLWMQVQTFYNGLQPYTQTMVDAASGGAMFNKSPEECYELFEVMASNNFLKSTDRNAQKRTAGVHNLDAFNTLAAQVALLNNNFKNLNVASVSHLVCDFCAGNHPSMECQAGNPFQVNAPNQVNYVAANQRPYNPNSNSYNQGWRNHPNFSWRDNSNVQAPTVGFQGQEKKPTMEEAFTQFMTRTTTFMEETQANFRNQGASIRNLEHQVGEISKLLTERAQGALPSNTERNPRETVKAITLRSGKELVNPKEASKQTVEENNPVLKDQNATPPVAQPLPPPVSNAIPFPQRLKKKNLDKNFSKFIDIFKGLHINLPFVDMLEQMPQYAKFLKQVLSNKRKLEENEKVMLTEECSAILQRKLPPKLKDPGSFTIPCTIGDVKFNKVLCDLGASINLMPLSVFRKLGLGEVKPTTVSLQFADRSIKHPRGIIENVLVKVDKFIFPADFIVLDMEEDQEIPLIFGRPFLATGRALIDVQQGELMLRVHEEQVTFKVFEATNVPLEIDVCFAISAWDRGGRDTCSELVPPSSPKECITKSKPSKMAKEKAMRRGSLGAAAFPTKRKPPDPPESRRCGASSRSPQRDDHPSSVRRKIQQAPRQKLLQRRGAIF